MGMSARQVLWQVEVPLALPVRLAGVSGDQARACELHK